VQADAAGTDAGGTRVTVTLRRWLVTPASPAGVTG